MNRDELINFLASCKTKLNQYEAYTMQDGHINFFEEVTLDSMRSLIHKIELKLAAISKKEEVNDVEKDIPSGQTIFGDESSNMEHMPHLEVELLAEYRNIESPPKLLRIKY